MKKISLFLFLIVFVNSISADCGISPNGGVSIVQDSVSEPRKKLSFREWLHDHSNGIKRATYKELAKNSDEFVGITILKVIMLLPLYAVFGAAVVSAIGGAVAMGIIACILIYALAAGAGVPVFSALLPYIAIALACMAGGATVALLLGYVSELPFFDKARPVAVGFYEVLGYIVVGVFYLLFEAFN